MNKPVKRKRVKYFDKQLFLAEFLPYLEKVKHCKEHNLKLPTVPNYVRIINLQYCT